MAKYKVRFSKLEKSGQQFYERSFSVESLELLLIVCETVRCEITKPRKRLGKIVFVMHRYGGYANFAAAQNVPFWIMKKFVPEKNWKR
jgi:hypothetical protein